MKTKKCFLIVVCLLILQASNSSPAFSQQGVASPSRTGIKPLTVERIFASDEFRQRSFDPTWTSWDTAKFTDLLKSKTVAGEKDIVEVDARSNMPQVLVSASQLIPPGTTTPLVIEGFDWSSDQKLMLISTNTQKVWRTNSRGDYWLLNRETGQLRQIGKDRPGSSLMFAKFSPDDQQVAFVSAGNLFSENVASGEIRQLTSSTSAEIINGTSDWVYEEEFDLKDCFRWSPDSQKIAYWQFDTSGVEEFTLINNTDSLYPTLKKFKHTKVGQTNSAVRIGVLDLSNGETTWLSVEGDSRDNYLARARWLDSQRILLQRLNRDQNTNSVLVADVTTGTTRVLFADTDDAWVETCDDEFEIENGKRFVWISEKDGWRHVYLADSNTGELTCVTPGEYDVIELLHANESQLLFIASPKNPTQRYLYRVSMEASPSGGSQAQRLSPTQQPGTHSYNVSVDGKLAIHSWSKMNQPPVYELVSLPDHAVLRTYTANPEIQSALQTLAPVQTLFVKVAMNDATLLDAWIMKPASFDPNKKYPLIVYVYGEPWGSTVTDEWGGTEYLWHRMLAEKGYAVCSIDNRGTKAPRGREFRKSIYKQVGILAALDQAAAVKALTSHFSWLDTKRVGVWGWSGGGSMSLNAIFKFPDIYQTAIAVASVPDQAYYDSIYQERYMGTLAKNPDGYRAGSPINFADQLTGNLLIIHGTGDDNCHYQTVERLIDELVKHDKQFSMMAYPNRSHSISEGQNTSVHLRKLMMNYFLDKLPARPK